MAAISGRATETLLLDLMEGDRLLVHHSRLWDGLQEELQYLTTAPNYVWQSIADALHVSSSELNCHALRSTVVSIGYR